MQVHTVALALVVPAPPTVKTKGTGGEWVSIGEKNTFFDELLAIKKGSTTLARCINTASRLIAGSGFTVDKAKAPKLFALLQKIDGRNSHRKLLKQIALDKRTFRGWAVQVIWNEEGSVPVEFHYQRFKQVRFGKWNDEGEIEEYYISRDWSKPTGKNKPVMIPAFNPDLASEQKRQLFVSITESDDIEYYPEPEYWAAINYAQLERDLSEFHVSNVQNRFTVGTILVTSEEPEPGEGETEVEAAQKFERSIEKKFTGANGKNLMVMTGVSNPDATKLLSYQTASGDTLYDTYAELCQQKILTANGFTSPVIAGIPGTGSLGGNGNELRNAYELFYNTECRPEQEEICEDFRMLLEYCDVEEEALETLDITTSLPVRMTFSENLLEQILPASRLRKWIDEPELTDEEKAEMGEGEPDQNDGGENLGRTVLEALARG
ncbi:phage portal family protein [Hymenobacter tenuis]